jgi:hypothetical protein
MMTAKNFTESQGLARGDQAPVRFDYVAHGLRIRIESESADLMDLAKQELPPGKFELPRDDLDVDRAYRIVSAEDPSAGPYLYTDGERSGHSNHPPQSSSAWSPVSRFMWPSLPSLTSFCMLEWCSGWG